MIDPQWTVELSVTNNETGARREIRIDGDLADALLGTIHGMSAVVGFEASRAINQAYEMLPPEFRTAKRAPDA
jgi:hypothetical protein